MRIRKLALAVLLSSTCLWSPAHAGPVAPFLAGVWAGLTTGVVAGAGITGAWAVGSQVGAFLVGGSFAARVVMAVGLSAISQAMMPKPPAIPPTEIMANYAQDVHFVEYAYGRVRKGGPYVLSAFSRGNVTNTIGDDDRAKRHYGILIAAHSTKGPVAHYLDKWEVETDASGFVISEPIKWPGGWAGTLHGQIRTYNGQPGQSADPIWLDIFHEVTASDDFAGLSYGALYAARPADELFTDIYPNGREWAYSPVWDGMDQIHDPRSDSRDWSNNAALVIADIATRLYGKTVDWDEVAAEATICDQLVANRDGGLQRRWTINTVIRSNMTWEEARGHLQMACDTFFYERRDGKLGFKVGYYSAPTVTLVAGDILSLSVRHKAVGPDEVGSYALKYVEPARAYNQEVTGAVVVNPLGARSEEECYGIDSHNQAWRVIYRWAKTAQPEYQISCTLKFIGREVMEQRFVRIQHAELGLDFVAEVSTLSRSAGSHTWQLEAVSVEAGDFSPDALALEPPRTLRETIAEDGTVPAPASLSGAVVEGTGGAAMIEWSWPAQTGDLRQQMRIRAPEIGAEEWQLVDIPSGQSTYLATGLADGATYDAQVRNRTGAGRVSDWVPEAPLTVTAVANSAPPAAMQDFMGMVAGSSVGLAFTPPNDPVYAAARIYRATDSADFSAAVLVQIEFGVANLADEWTDPAPGIGTHNYWIEPINGSGIPGPRSGPLTLSII